MSYNVGGMNYSTRAPNCLKCLYFKVTGDNAFPRACTFFGIKCPQGLPSFAVFKNTGKHCPCFKKNPKIKE